MTTPARIWRDKYKRYRLEGAKCDDCGKIFFPDRQICDKCKSRKLSPYRLPNKGKVITHTVIHTPPTQFEDEAPYAMSIVELEDGSRLFAQLVDVPLDDISTGMPVKVEFRKIQSVGESGVLCYGYKFVPDVSA